MQKTCVLTEAEPVQIRLLGRLSVQAGQQEVTDEATRSPKLWSVLCYLILQRRRGVSREELIDLFWDADDRANPASALRTLLHRIRGVLSPLFDESVSPIVSQNGLYRWNPAIPCVVDAEEFERLFALSRREELSPEERAEHCLACLELYQGNFLQRLSDYTWVSTHSARCHHMYLDAVKSGAAWLQSQEKYEQMHELCARAAAIAPLDEELHILIIRSLLLLKQHSAAQKHYERASDALYRDLGVRPSEELRNLYNQIMCREETIETDLSLIQETLRELDIGRGAFVCEYGVFKEVYRLEARRAIRSGGCLHVGLMTVSKPDGSMPQAKTLHRTMEQLAEVIIGSLRMGDVVSRYSAAQFVIMLPNANLEDSHMVMNRIINAFYRRHHRSTMKLSYSLRELELAQPKRG